MNVLKKRAGATWGSTNDTLNARYKTYIKPVIAYGSEVSVTAVSYTHLDVYKRQGIYGIVYI